MNAPGYITIVRHYERCLDKHGDTHLGVDWPNEEDAETRYRVMLEVIREPSSSSTTLLDFGCGASHMYEFMQRQQFAGIQYSGLDISEKFISLAKRKFPEVDFFHGDVLQDKIELPAFDYIIMNGVFTEKLSLPFEEMFSYFRELVSKVFTYAKKGLALNVMSHHVDWQRDDLFHLPYDTLAKFLVQDVSRHFVFRSDYRMFEYTVYVYR